MSVDTVRRRDALRRLRAQRPVSGQLVDALALLELAAASCRPVGREDPGQGARALRAAGLITGRRQFG